MLNLLLPILPSLGLLIMMVLGYFIFRTKVNEYNQKFSSMFSLLSAMTDEIKKLKQMKMIGNNGPFIPIEVDNNIVNDENESEYSTEDECESDEEVDESGYQHDVESDDEGNELKKCDISDAILLDKTSHSQDETEGKDEDEEEDEDEKEDIVSYNVEEALDNNKEITIHEENLDYNKMSMKEMQSLAKSKGLGGDNNSKLKKQDLIELLTSNTVVLE